MRNPAIHITLSVLERILQEEGIKEYKKISKKILQKGYRYRLQNRTNILVDEKVRAKIKSIPIVNDPIVEKFNLLLVANRTNKKHIHIKSIQTTSVEYKTLKEITTYAEEFTKLYELERTNGYNTYIDIGLYFMGRKYGLNKFKYYNEKIFNIYSKYVIVNSDKKIAETKAFYKEWETQLLETAGIQIEYSKLESYIHIEKYSHIILGREEAEENNASFNEWIKAQFEGLSWLNSVPEVCQLYGVEAVERYRKYQIKKSIQKKEEVIPEEYRNNPTSREYYQLLKKIRERKEELQKKIKEI